MLLRHLRADGTRIEDLHHLPHCVVKTLVDVVIERITADKSVKVIDVRIATEEEVAAVFISAKVHRVGRTS